jgi:hypothetical protein
MFITIKEIEQPLILAWHSDNEMKLIQNQYDTLLAWLNDKTTTEKLKLLCNKYKIHSKQMDVDSECILFMRYIYQLFISHHPQNLSLKYMHQLNDSIDTSKSSRNNNNNQSILAPDEYYNTINVLDKCKQNNSQNIDNQLIIQRCIDLLQQQNHQQQYKEEQNIQFDAIFEQELLAQFESKN